MFFFTLSIHHLHRHPSHVCATVLVVSAFFFIIRGMKTPAVPWVGHHDCCLHCSWRYSMCLSLSLWLRCLGYLDDQPPKTNHPVYHHRHWSRRRISLFFFPFVLWTWRCDRYQIRLFSSLTHIQEKKCSVKFSEYFKRCEFTRSLKKELYNFRNFKKNIAELFWNNYTTF